MAATKPLLDKSQNGKTSSIIDPSSDALDEPLEGCNFTSAREQAVAGVGWAWAI